MLYTLYTYKRNYDFRFSSMETTCDAMINAMGLDATDVLEYFAKNIHDFISEIGNTLSSKVKQS